MKYQIILKTEATNIKVISVEQTFKIKIKCLNCNSESEKPMVITSESEVRRDVGVFNFISTCHVCTRQLKVDVNPPKEQKYTVINSVSKAEEEVSLFPAKKVDDYYVVSEMIVNGGDLVYLDVYEMNLVDGMGSFYPNVKINKEENTWGEGFNDFFSSLADYSFEFKRIK